MVVILRHDVDQGYANEPEFDWITQFYVLGLNQLNLRFAGNFLPGIPRLHYLRDAERLFEAEKNLGIKSTWFFRRRTRPHHAFSERLLRHGCEIAFHADRTRDESAFLKDISWTWGNSKPLGFSKHGSARNRFEAKIRRCEIYDPVRCLQLAKKYGFRYFSGNGTDPEETYKVIESVVYFPSAFWMFPGYMQNRKHTLEWLIKIHKDQDVVVLIHPREYTGLFPRLKQKIDTFLARVEEVVSFDQFIVSFRRSAVCPRSD